MVLNRNHTLNRNDLSLIKITITLQPEFKAESSKLKAILERMDNVPDISYWLTHYKTEKVTTKSEINLLKREEYFGSNTDVIVKSI